ncbi:HAMP domain-containing sensor histidine kinase [Streptomyces sp. YIM 121038]|uniref:HAMP domain-containing sensor histidine kinase n=1 Tax=Streptomyces sp. YIM 121038 TaxID=2136401 RepID=UPI0031FEE9D1
MRWQIAALVTISCCAVSVVVGILVHDTTQARSLNEYRIRAEEQLESALEAHARGEEKPGAELEDPAGIFEELRGASTGSPATWHDQRNPQEPRMWAAEPAGDQVMVVSVDMTYDRLARDGLDRDMVKAVLVALAIVAPLAALVAELLNRRLRRVAATARRITAGALEARIGAKSPLCDEISDISAALDTMVAALQRRLLSEQRFTADVAHELRTPLMGLVTSAGLLPECEATELVRGRVRVLRKLVEDLLEISRLDAGAEQAHLVEVSLREVVRDCVARTGYRARVKAVGTAVVETDPRRLDRIIANLVVNAHRHGSPPVEVTVHGTSVVVRDHGPGFPEAVREGGPQRFRTGAAERGNGHGLGLTIALGQALVLGANLTFTNAPGGGATATLHLTPGHH